jgi:enamine deaminase RidA (YjgF/YER057c/UK114 family)
MSDHRTLEPDGMTPAIGFSHGMITEGGRVVYIAGQTGHHADQSIEQGLVAQFAQACRSVSRVIEEAGGSPADLVSMTIFTTDLQAYRDSLKPIGEAYRSVFGKHFPAMALIGVAGLFDPKAVVELSCIAVVPD